MEHISFHTQGADVYVCPYLMNGPKRSKDDAAWRQLVHSDADGDDAKELRPRCATGGFVVWRAPPAMAMSTRR